MARHPQAEKPVVEPHGHGIHAPGDGTDALQRRGVRHMTSWSRAIDAVTDERGAVLVTFTLFAPVLILMAAFTMDGGNWLLHKRHLQVQADAAVFAAAKEFQPCFDENI